MNSVARKTHSPASFQRWRVNQLPFVNHFALTIITEAAVKRVDTRLAKAI
jgi:hypothetical protein